MMKVAVALLSLTALGFQAAHFAFYFVEEVEGEMCASASGGRSLLPGFPAGLCSAIVTGPGSPKAYEIAVGKDSTPGVDTPPAPPILNALVWAGVGLLIAVISATLHLVLCGRSARCLLALTVINLLCVCPAFSYLGTTRYTLESGLTAVDIEVKPSFTWGPGCNLGALLTLLVLIALDVFRVKTTPANSSTTRNVDIEAGAAPAPRAAKAAKAAKAKAEPKAPAAKPAAKKPPPKYSAEPAAAA